MMISMVHAINIRLGLLSALLWEQVLHSPGFHHIRVGFIRSPSIFVQCDPWTSCPPEAMSIQISTEGKQVTDDGGQFADDAKQYTKDGNQSPSFANDRRQ